MPCWQYLYARTKPYSSQPARARLMVSDELRTITRPVATEFIERGSRFIGYLAPVMSVEQANELVVSVSDEHPDATHIVPAYRINTDPITEYTHDDGEPGGSAGKPALGVLQAEELLDIAAVVVRYYGGTNLGYGGLVRAYARAVRDSLDEAEVVCRRPVTTVTVATSYDDSGTVRGILESMETTFDASYDVTVTFTVTVADEELDGLIDRLQSATSGRVTVDSPTPSNRK